MIIKPPKPGLGFGILGFGILGFGLARLGCGENIDELNVNLYKMHTEKYNEKSHARADLKNVLNYIPMSKID